VAAHLARCGGPLRAGAPRSVRAQHKILKRRLTLGHGNVCW
jgi:hypothetical protein